MWNDLREKEFRENTLPERYLSMPGEGNTREQMLLTKLSAACVR